MTIWGPWEGTAVLGKFWYESKTIWANALVVLIAGLTAVAGTEVVADYPQIASGILAVVGVLNIALRFVTGRPITKD